MSELHLPSDGISMTKEELVLRVTVGELHSQIPTEDTFRSLDSLNSLLRPWSKRSSAGFAPRGSLRASHLQPVDIFGGSFLQCPGLLGVGEPRLQVHILLTGHVGLSSCEVHNYSYRPRNLRSTWRCPIHCLVVGIVDRILQGNMKLDTKQCRVHNLQVRLDLPSQGPTLPPSPSTPPPTLASAPRPASRPE